MASRKPKAPPGPLATEFLRLLDEAEAEAKAKGVTMAVVCKEADIARAQPVRWRAKVPSTIVKFDKMMAAIKNLPAVEAVTN